jgi:hypothetical protein
LLNKPTQPPIDPREHLRTRIRTIVDGAEKPTKEHKITHRVTGGPPTRRVENILEISGTGSVIYRTYDELKERRVETYRLTLSSERVSEIFRELLESRLLEYVDTGGGFLPDSLVGSITVEDGISRMTYYFLADEGQRHDQGLELPSPLASVHRVLRQLADRITHEEGVGERNHRPD